MKVYILMARNIVETKNQLIADDKRIFNVFDTKQKAVSALSVAQINKEKRFKYFGFEYRVEDIENGYMWKYKNFDKGVVMNITEVLELTTEEVY